MMHNSFISNRRKIVVPIILLLYKQFVVWRLEYKVGQKKPSKIPYNPLTGMRASSTNPVDWTDFGTANLAYLNGNYDGIGFVLTTGDPLAVIDIDDCKDKESGRIEDHAQKIVDMMPGSTWETSQSGNGLHGFCSVHDKQIFSTKRKKWIDPNGNKFECYFSERFIALGICDWSNPTVIGDHTSLLLGWLPSAGGISDENCEWVDEARPDYSGPENDNELIKRAFRSRSAASMFGASASFEALWNGDNQVLSAFFPAIGEDRPFDNSSAEFALASHLAFWTGCNPVRIEQIMMSAPLCARQKWQVEPKYRRRTIAKVISDPKKSYIKSDERKALQIEENISIGAGEAPVLTPTLDLKEMIDFLVHVGDGGQLVDRRTKTIRSREDASLWYSASTTDLPTGRYKTDGTPICKAYKTLEMWRKAKERKSVDGVTWQPDEAEFCMALEGVERGYHYNIWAGLFIHAAPENWEELVEPFLLHVKYLVPVETERTRFLQWLAHIFQKPGELPHTSYLMIATQTGIGRGTLASMIVRALAGYVAANVDVSTLLNKGFNGRLAMRLLATVDEIHEGGSQRWLQQENLKSALTEEVRLINRKYGRQYVEKNCLRWLLFSNHLDALPFDTNDRRIIVVRNPDTRMPPEWFKSLYARMHDQRFIASIQKYFLTLDISDFKPGEIAPMNEAKRLALKSMESPADAAARQFSEIWPGDFATVSDIRRFIGDDAPLHSSAMRHTIERAGMKSARKQRVDNINETIVIVKGAIGPDDLIDIPPANVANVIRQSRFAFHDSQNHPN